MKEDGVEEEQSPLEEMEEKMTYDQFGSEVEVEMESERSLSLRLNRAMS